MFAGPPQRINALSSACSRIPGQRSRASALLSRAVLAVSLSAALLAVLLGCSASGGSARPIALASENWTIQIDPESLEVTAQPTGRARVSISVPQEGLGPVKRLKRGDQEVSWEFEQSDLQVSFRVEGETLHANFVATQPGAFTWPVVVGDPPVKAYTLPLFEGSYVPADDAEWLEFLAWQSPGNTTETLSMPFWGLDCTDYSVAYILTNQFNNELVFEDRGGKLAIRLAHEFTRNRDKKEYGLVIRLGEASPIESARQYRSWLIEQGEFVSLREKIEQVPAVEKLLGAAHIYLWGDDLISRYDVLDWRRLPKMIIEQGKSSRPSPGKRIWDLMSSETHTELVEAASLEYPYRYLKDQIARALSEVLGNRDLYTEAAWRGMQLPAEARQLLSKGTPNLNEPQVLRLNSLLLEAAFPGAFAPSNRWGNGISLKMMEEFAKGGFDRLWLGLASWQGGFRHPQAIRRAKGLGYLIGTYDSYHDIHHPEEPDTWETAQFDLQLYETGAVVRADGTNKRGFLRKGYILSSVAAWPYVKKRVTGLMETLPEPFNSWFIDCDAYGDLFDDYSELHPATQEDDMNARLHRMAWIRDTYGLVIGSEGGVAYSAPVVHFAHGMMTPVFDWMDPDLSKNKESEYYLGNWGPLDGPNILDGPGILLRRVLLKPRFRKYYYDPRYRLPLYQTVFHDSVVATHHWQYASLKFTDQVDTVELLELLYNVPPLYHMNLEEFERHKDRMAAHYEFFSPLHRELALLPLTDFAWLTPDRMVQRTVFGESVEMVANFGRESFMYQGSAVPARSVVARWRDTRITRNYTPLPCG